MKRTLRTSMRMASPWDQLCAPGISLHSATTKAARTTPRSESLRAASSEARRGLSIWRTRPPHPLLGQLDARAPLEKVEQHEHALAGGEPPLDQANEPAERAVVDDDLGALGQRGDADHAVGPRPRAQEGHRRRIELGRHAAERDEAPHAGRPPDAQEVALAHLREEVAGEHRPHRGADRRPRPLEQQRQVRRHALAREPRFDGALLVTVRLHDPPDRQLGRHRHGSARRARLAAAPWQIFSLVCTWHAQARAQSTFRYGRNSFGTGLRTPLSTTPTTFTPARSSCSRASASAWRDVTSACTMITTPSHSRPMSVASADCKSGGASSNT